MAQTKKYRRPGLAGLEAALGALTDTHGLKELAIALGAGAGAQAVGAKLARLVPGPQWARPVAAILVALLGGKLLYRKSPEAALGLVAGLGGLAVGTLLNQFAGLGVPGLASLPEEEQLLGLLDNMAPEQQALPAADGVGDVDVTEARPEAALADVDVTEYALGDAEDGGDLLPEDEEEEA
jgi:hypothetical protein